MVINWISKHYKHITLPLQDIGVLLTSSSDTVYSCRTQCCDNIYIRIVSSTGDIDPVMRFVNHNIHSITGNFHLYNVFFYNESVMKSQSLPPFNFNLRPTFHLIQPPLHPFHLSPTNPPPHRESGWKRPEKLPVSRSSSLSPANFLNPDRLSPHFILVRHPVVTCHRCIYRLSSSAHIPEFPFLL